VEVDGNVADAREVLLVDMEELCRRRIPEALSPFLKYKTGTVQPGRYPTSVDSFKVMDNC